MKPSNIFCRVFLVISLVGILSGCILTKETFFTPSAERGKTEGRYCRGKFGPPTTVLFQHPEVEIIVSSILEYQLITVSLGKAVDAKILIHASQFSIKTKSKVEPLSLSKLTKYQYFNPFIGGDLSPLEIPSASDQLVLESDDNMRNWFFLEFPVNLGKENEFILMFPPIWVNGKMMSVPPITWTLQNDWFILPINC